MGPRGDTPPRARLGRLVSASYGRLYFRLAQVSRLVHHGLIRSRRAATEGERMAADFGRIEVCGCCGKDVKKPVFSKRLNIHLGKDCFNAIMFARQEIRFWGLEQATATLKRDWPRSWQRLVELAK